MQRHVKYRIWKPEEKRWVSFPTKGLQSFEPIVAPLYTDCDYFIVQEFTGFLDKNGKEIYEGDFIKHWEYPVSFEEGCFWITAEYDLMRVPLYELNFKEVEVIGNNCENPDLTK